MDITDTSIDRTSGLVRRLISAAITGDSVDAERALMAVGDVTEDEVGLVIGQACVIAGSALVYLEQSHNDHSEECPWPGWANYLDGALAGARGATQLAIEMNEAIEEAGA